MIAKMSEMNQNLLKKHDVKLHTVVFMIFCLVAGGAYGIEEMIPESGPGVALMLLIILPFIWGLPFGLVASELGSARPQEGGYYKWVQEALGEFWGFQAGWWRTVSIYIDNTVYVVLIGNYLAGQFHLNTMESFVVKAIFIIVFTYFNLRGIKDVGLISSLLSILVIVAFAMIAICGILNWQTNPFIPFTADGEIMGIHGIGFNDWVYYIGAGLAIATWQYAGYESMSTMAGELRNPQLITKATIISVPLVMSLYIFPTMAGLASMGQWQNWGSESGTLGYSDVVTTFWGPAFGAFFVLVAVVANSSIFNAYIASGSRGFFVLADDHLAPPILVKCDKKHGVPYVAVLSMGIASLILCNLKFSTIIVVDVFMLVSSYVMVYISALILRKRLHKSEYKFRIPGGFPVLLLVCIVPIFIAFALMFISGTDYFIGGMLGVLTGPIIYFFWKRKYGGLAKVDAVKYPINSKTKLAVGDVKRTSQLFFIFAAMGAIAVPWLRYYEGGWAYEYYPEEYGSGLLSNFDAMLSAIGVATVVFVALGVIFWIIGSKVEPKRNK